MRDAVRTRIAPSPTGWLHVGTARTALFNYLYARQHNGVFVLRIEDTDIERSKKEFEDSIIEGLKWLGLFWDEGPYRQSERTDMYRIYMQTLLDNGLAFYCGHSVEELEQERKDQMKQQKPICHHCTQRDEGREQGIIRLTNDSTGTISFSDIIRGPISFDAPSLGDFPLARDRNHALYNFTVVVDDWEMHISHVIRGEDHISNTPKQILIQQALGFEKPHYAHLPLLLGTDRSKLSKRHGETSIMSYRDEGYLPEALCNFLALLGWNPGDDRELFSLKELQKEFSLEKVQKSGAVFNGEKLQWINGEYIRRMDVAALADRVVPFISQGVAKDKNYIKKVVAVEQPRMKLLSDIEKKAPFFFYDPVYDTKLLLWKGTQNKQNAKEHLATTKKLLCDIDERDGTREGLRDIIMSYAERNGRGDVLWPLRVALSGQATSPDPLEILSVINKEVALRRIDHAIELLNTSV